MMAKTKRNMMKKKVSRLLAVTRLTPKRMVRSSLPWDVLKLWRSTYAMHPLSLAENKATNSLCMYLMHPLSLAENKATIWACTSGEKMGNFSALPDYKIYNADWDIKAPSHNAMILNFITLVKLVINNHHHHHPCNISLSLSLLSPL